MNFDFRMNRRKKNLFVFLISVSGEFSRGCSWGRCDFSLKIHLVHPQKSKVLIRRSSVVRIKKLLILDDHDRVFIKFDFMWKFSPKEYTRMQKSMVFMNAQSSCNASVCLRKNPHKTFIMNFNSIKTLIKAFNGSSPLKMFQIPTIEIMRPVFINFSDSPKTQDFCFKTKPNKINRMLHIFNWIVPGQFSVIGFSSYLISSKDCTM